MKRILTLIILTLTIQCSFAQSCGIYRIHCIGEIKSKSLEIHKIKLPTMDFLFGKEEENSRNKFKEIQSNENKINITLLGFEYLSDKPKNLLEFFKTKSKSIPITVKAIQNGKNKEIQVELAWDNIQIKKLKNDKFGELFELNLNEISIK